MEIKSGCGVVPCSPAYATLRPGFLAPRLPETSGRRIPSENEPSAMRRFCEEVDNQLITEISGWLRVPFFPPLSMSVFW